MLFWKSEGLQTGLGKQIVSALAFYFCSPWLQLHLPTPHTQTPPTPHPSQGSVPSLPLTASHSPFVFDSWEAFFKLLLSVPSLWNIGKLPARSLAPAPHCQCWQQFAQSSARLCPSTGAHRQPPPPLLLPSFRQTSCTGQWLNSLHSNCFIAPLAFRKCWSSKSSDTWYRVPSHSFGKQILKISQFIPAWMIMQDRGPQVDFFC